MQLIKNKIVIKIAVLSVLCIVLITSVAFIYSSNIPQISVIKPINKEIVDNIYVTGTLVEKSRRSIKLDIPVVVNNVYHELGDTVSNGAVIADIDVLATKTALLEYLSSLANIPDSYSDLISDIDVDAQKLLNFIPSKVIANTSGTITELNLISGFTTTIGETLVTISDLSKLYCKFSVSEEQMRNIAVGDEVLFKSLALNDQVFRGSVASIAPTAKEKLVGMSKQTVVDIYVNMGQSDLLKPGYSVTGEIKKTLDNNVMTIPYTAINQDDQNKEFVYLYKNNIAVKQYITTGREFESVVEVTEGITQDSIVILNSNKIKNNYSLVKLK